MIGRSPFLKKKGAGFSLQSFPGNWREKGFRRIYPELVEGIPNAALILKNNKCILYYLIETNVNIRFGQ